MIILVGFGIKVLHLLLPDHQVRIDVQNRSLTVNQEDFSVSNNQLDSNWCLLLNARRYHIEDDNILVVNLDAYHLQLQVGPGSNILIKVILKSSIIHLKNRLQLRNESCNSFINFRCWNQSEGIQIGFNRVYKWAIRTAVVK